MWKYVVNTLDPVVENTLLKDSNYFYRLCLMGRYSEECVCSCASDNTVVV